MMSNRRVASLSIGRGVSLSRMNDEPMSAQTESWPRPHRLTVHDYYRMAEVGVLQPDDRTELIEGEIVDMPPIGSRHASVVTRLTRLLIRAVERLGRGPRSTTGAFHAAFGASAGLRARESETRRL
jgi:Uma2 family endonuclease